MIKRATVKQN